MSERTSFEVDPRLAAAATQADILLRALECRLCDGRVTDPREVDCGHVFCLECLRAHVEDAGPDITCPTCRMAVTMPSGGVDHLPVQYLYDDLAREVTCLEKDNKMSRGSCKFCNDNFKLPAMLKCINCNMPMCEKCASNHVHNGVNSVVPIHRKPDSLLCDYLPKRDTACLMHQTESLLLFCNTCQTCICFKCKEETHSNHAVSELENASNSAKNAITDIHERVKDYLNETKEAVNDIERIGNEYHKKVSTARKQIEDQADMLVRHILQEKKRLLDELDTHAEDIQARLDTCHFEMEGKEARARALSDLSESVLCYGNEAENVLYKERVDEKWQEMQEEKLSRFGQGFKMDVQFYLNESHRAITSSQMGHLMVTQTLSPWTSRKSRPFDVMPSSPGPYDVAKIHLKVRSAISNDFSLKRSPIFAKFVDPKWTVETYKTCRSTGQTVTVWLKPDEDQENASRASKRISMRSVSQPCLTAEIESFNEKGEPEYRKTFEKLPDGTTIRLAIAGKDTIILAVYPGLYASSIISQAKLKSLSKKDTDGIYVAVLERGNFVCGELRKIPIPEGPGFDFEISSRNVIVVKPLLQANLKIYNTKGGEFITDHALHEATVLKIIEAPDNQIYAITRQLDGSVVCETISDTGERWKVFSFPAETLRPLQAEFREARFDRNGKALIHFQAAGTQDLVYLVCISSHQREVLAKPELLHKIDKLALLPDGRLCVFDKAECVLMTLKYL